MLRFYGPVNPIGSCRARSVFLTTRLPVLCTFFRQKLTTALLESAEGREWPYKIFHDQSPRKNVADLGGGWTRDLLVSSRTAHPTEPPRPARPISITIFTYPQILQGQALCRTKKKKTKKKKPLISHFRKSKLLAHIIIRELTCFQKSN